MKSFLEICAQSLPGHADIKNVIINADDFGLNAQVTDAIIECFRKSLITQTTLLVNSDYAEDAVARARSEGYSARVGLHLNFTAGTPLTNPIRRFSEICDAEGNFRSHTFGNGFWPLHGAIVGAIRAEAKAQMEKYCDLNLPLMHCDGHHHVHNRLQFSYVVLPLLKQYGFKSVRNRYSIFVRPWIRSIRGRVAIGVFETLARYHGLKFTSGFGGWNGESLVRWRKFDSFELMVHPNYDQNGTNVNVTDFANRKGPRMADIKEAINAF